MKLKTVTFLYVMVLALSGIAIVMVTNYGLKNTSNASDIWREFKNNRSEKSVALNDLRAQLGYGGMIHNYKNYILRHDLRYKNETLINFGAVESGLKAYKTFRLNSAESVALLELERVLREYRDALGLIDQGIASKKSAKEVDLVVKINDEPALMALKVLNREKNPGYKIIENKSNILQELYEAIGYGGMIHQFKNYILRGDAAYKESALSSYNKAIKVLGQYKNYKYSDIELKALESISSMLKLYASKLEIAEALRKDGLTAAEIDTKVKVDDRPALLAFDDLKREIYIQAENRSSQLDGAFQGVMRSGEYVVFITSGSLFLAISSFVALIYFHMIYRITSLTDTMIRLASDEVNVNIKWQDSLDEIGDMSRMLEVFRNNIIQRKKIEIQLLDVNSGLEEKIRERTFELANKEQRLSSLLETAVDSIITIDGKGVIQSFNSAAIKMFGYELDEVIGHNLKMLMPEPYSAEHDSYLEKYLRTHKPAVIGIGREVYARRKNGNVFPMELAVSEINNNGEVIYTGIIRDLSERKQQEEKIRRAQKMDALGKLVGGIAHDFNNILNVIIGYSDLLEAMKYESEKTVEYVSAIKHAGNRGAKLTQKLLGFSRDKPGQVRSVININDIILEEQDVLRKSLTSLIDVEFDLQPDLWLCYIESEDFEDAILNLSINAMHAMPNGGKLIFHSKNIVLDEFSSKDFDLPQGEYVMLQVQDTGTGMSDEVISHAFEPFYSTKQDKGTGLGLSQVYGFMQRSQGGINISSHAGEGATFIVLFPRHVATEDSGVSDNLHSNNISDDYHGSEKILVVDDEEFLCVLANDIISSYGYSVKTVTRAKEALDILKHEHFDLVLSDVIMPEMDGFSFASKIKELYPEIIIQMVSGYSNINQLHGDKELIDSMLVKPYEKAALMRAIRQRLDEKNRSIKNVL